MFVVFRLSRDQIMYQIQAKLNNLWRSYCDFIVYNVGAVRHVGFDPSEFAEFATPGKRE